MGVLVAIEGGRAIKARNVQAIFADKAEELSTTFDMPAGFAITMWDDQGEMTTVSFCGERSPYSRGMLIDMLKAEVAAHFNASTAA